ncbi:MULTISPECIES: class GN sortase [unclassified Rhizobium]|jgi:sortase A|uniref:class GN sortase n=1 Tax=Rhizobium sp. BK313 TaxID=2587081 RepID=UPI00105B7B8B
MEGESILFSPSPLGEKVRKGSAGEKRFHRLENLAFACVAVLALTGLTLLSSGLYMKAKAELAQILLKRAFAAELRGEDAKPWPWADFTTEAEVRAPRIGAEAIVLAGASGQALAFGPGWLTNTPQPGEEGTAVIAAHRDTHFRWLKDVKPGDLIEITLRDGKVLTFRAGQGRVARWDQNGIDPAAAGRHLALATCWPFGAVTRGPLRYIVDAELVETDGNGVTPREQTASMDTKTLSRL